MLCLGIETSCDDTSLALVREGKLIGQVASAQVDIHALFGGVVPELASREHARLIGPLCDKLFSDTGLTLEDIDVVSVARGPGLLGSLLVGVAFAKTIAAGLNTRFIGVNHLHAHLMAVGLEKEFPFPSLGLLVSGGHTHLYRIESPTSFIALGKTVDDAAGEAFDKAGKMLGLPYPAGRIMDELANEGRADKRLFPRPYLKSGNLDFSFSGLKTAMQTYLTANKHIPVCWDTATGRALVPEKGEKRQNLADCCASYRLAVVETLAVKTKAALDAQGQSDIKGLVLAGGVAANSLLRSTFAGIAEEFDKEFITPSLSLCTDNGAMIAYLGWLLAEKGYHHPFSMEAIPKGRKIPDDMQCFV